MAEKKRVYHSDVMALPSLRLVIGDVPSPDPEQRRKSHTQKPDPLLENNVKKLIVHLTTSK